MARALRQQLDLNKNLLRPLLLLLLLMLCQMHFGTDPLSRTPHAGAKSKIFCS
jgi:hypothetical protein